ncbi:hypothetical protein HYZ70_03850 [Candidatus Curtissbacteria bacterium]|nr:hypothetical protein [Candidatus Curtissbacteria bacterium]
MKVEANMIGGEPPPGPPSPEARAPEVVTRQQAEAKAKEAKVVYSRLMDQMEQARATQGDFFLGFGNKTPQSDDRALLLISPGNGGPGRERDKGYVVITGDGPMIMTVVHFGGQRLAEEFEEFIEDLSSGRFTNVTGEYIRETEGLGGDSLLKISYDKAGQRLEKQMRIAAYRYPDPYIASALESSVRDAESPHKRTLSDAQRNIDLANSLSARVSQLPPKE